MNSVDVLYLVVQDVALPEQLEAVAAQVLHVLLDDDAHQLAEQHHLRVNSEHLLCTKLERWMQYSVLDCRMTQIGPLFSSYSNIYVSAELRKTQKFTSKRCHFMRHCHQNLKLFRYDVGFNINSYTTAGGMKEAKRSIALALTHLCGLEETLVVPIGVLEREEAGHPVVLAQPDGRPEDEAR